MKAKRSSRKLPEKFPRKIPEKFLPKLHRTFPKEFRLLSKVFPKKFLKNLGEAFQRN